MSPVSGITYTKAATILGCHVSNVPKLIAKGELTSSGTRGASFAREEVEALARRRAKGREARAARRPRKYQHVDHRPDTEHDWLSVRQVAELLGVTRPAVMGRIHRERLPAVEKGGRFWVRRDLLASRSCAVGAEDEAAVASRTPRPLYPT